MYPNSAMMNDMSGRLLQYCGFKTLFYNVDYSVDAEHPKVLEWILCILILSLERLINDFPKYVLEEKYSLD